MEINGQCELFVCQLWSESVKGLYKINKTKRPINYIFSVVKQPSSALGHLIF
jgi:hypothetical protein